MDEYVCSNGERLPRFVCKCLHPRWMQFQSGEGTCQNCDADVTGEMFLDWEDEVCGRN